MSVGFMRSNCRFCSGIFTLILWLCIEVGPVWSAILWLLLWLYTMLCMINDCLVKSIILNEKTISYVDMFKKYEMPWEEIKLIGIGYYPIRGRSNLPWIYFSADGYFSPALIQKKVNNRFFMAHYRKEIEKTVRQYWKGDIAGINSVE